VAVRTVGVTVPAIADYQVITELNAVQARVIDHPGQVYASSHFAARELMEAAREKGDV
jgi:hypothetical protein